MEPLILPNLVLAKLGLTQLRLAQVGDAPTTTPPQLSHEPSLIPESLASRPKGLMVRRHSPRSSFVTCLLLACAPRKRALFRSVAIWRLSHAPQPTCPVKCFDPDLLQGASFVVTSPSSSPVFHSSRCACDCLGHHRARVLGGAWFRFWSQQPHGCVVRQERESRRTFSCGMWTLWQHERRTNDGLKSSLKGCPFSVPCTPSGVCHLPRGWRTSPGAALDAATSESAGLA